MPGSTLYDWSASRRVTDWKLEGRGELQLADDGALLVRTYDNGPLRRATNVWLKDLVLPPAFEAEWTFRSDSAAGNTMVLFNARPVLPGDLFDDPRADALYCDLAAYHKMVCYTIGFHRGPYGKPSVLRKLGGRTPLEWQQCVWPTPAWHQLNESTTMLTADEPIGAADKGKPHQFKLARRDRRAQFFVNGHLLHDFTDDGRYRWHPEPLTGGRLGFRNFTGFADDLYTSIIVRG